MFSNCSFLGGDVSQKKFGSQASTGRKLDVIGTYIEMYQRALQNTPFQTVYIDGFAGSGEVPLEERDDDLIDAEVASFIQGSASRAMNVSPAFTHYTFIDKRRACIQSLEAKFEGNKNLANATFMVGDANDLICDICQSFDGRQQRGVLFLDPFGSQVKWSTIEAIAKTKALDLWYLFPAGVSVFRQIGKDGSVHDTHEASITRIFGTDDWKSAFFAPSQQDDLFDPEPKMKKIVTPESAAQFMVSRLKGVFEGGVLDEMVPLGKHAYPSYYLLFAWANPSDKARNLARKIAQAAIKATDRKHGRLI